MAKRLCSQFVIENEVLVRIRGYKYDITSLVVPEGVTTIACNVFAGLYALTGVTLPSKLTHISNNAFGKCTGITSLAIPHGVTRIGQAAFQNCSGLTSVTLPRSLTRVGSEAFRSCSSLTSLILPRSLTRVGRHTFANCTALTSVVFRAEVSKSFLAWSVGSSRHRDNWRITTLAHSRNILRLITEFAVVRRAIRTLDPSWTNALFEGCCCLSGDLRYNVHGESYMELYCSLSNIEKLLLM